MTRAARAAGLILATLLVGCGSNGEAANHAEGGRAATSPSMATAGACGLLTLADVQAVFPDVTQNKPEDRLAKQGIQACDWNTGSGARTVQVRVSESSVDDELGTFEMGVLDPTKGGAKLIRQSIPGAQGQALVARQDEAKGILQSVAVAAVQEGAKTVTIVSSAIAARPDAGERLGNLAKTAAGRLN